MKEVYDHYELHFLKLNPPTKASFESASRAYSFLYGKFLPADKNARILDVGCGIGHFLYFLKNNGYTNFFGIDFSKAQIDFIKENITKKAAVADAFVFLREAKSPFDLIVINDVLEHVPKEKLFEFLGLVLNCLNSGSTVFIKVPNMSNPFGLRSRYISITHELGLTEHSLLEVLEIAGFSDIKIIGAFPPVISFKSFIAKMACSCIYKMLKLMFLIQGYPPPKILTKDVVAIAKRK